MSINDPISRRGRTEETDTSLRCGVEGRRRVRYQSCGRRRRWEPLQRQSFCIQNYRAFKYKSHCETLAGIIFCLRERTGHWRKVRPLFIQRSDHCDECMHLFVAFSIEPLPCFIVLFFSLTVTHN